jgi:hypothetical protein
MARAVCSPFPIQGISHEKNVPALPKASCPPIRLSGPHGHEERPRDHQSPPGRWPETSCRRWNHPQVRPPHAGLSSVVAAVDDRRRARGSAALLSPRPPIPFWNGPLFPAKFYFTLIFFKQHARQSNGVARAIAFPNGVWERRNLKDGDGHRPPLQRRQPRGPIL